MTALQLTHHGSVRMAQRGISNRDIDLITLIGSEVDDGYLVLNKDCQVFIRKLKKLISNVQRLQGKRVVVVDGQIITVFHANKEEQKRILRRTEKRAMEQT